MSLLGCATRLSKASWLSIIDHLPHKYEFSRSIHIPVDVASNEPRLDVVKVESCFLLWRHMWHVWHYLYYDYAV